MELKVLTISIACLSLITPSVFSIPDLEAEVATLGAAKGTALVAANGLVAKEAKALAAKGAAAIAAKGPLLKGLLAAKKAALKEALATKGEVLKKVLAAKGKVLKGALAVKGKALKRVLAAKGKALKGALAAKGKALKEALVAKVGKIVKVGTGIINGDLPIIQPSVIVMQPVEIPPAPVLQDLIIDYKPEFQFPLSLPPISTVSVEVREPHPGISVDLIRDNLEAAAKLKTQLFGEVISNIKESPLVYDIIQTPRYSTPYTEVTEEIKDTITK